MTEAAASGRTPGDRTRAWTRLLLASCVALGVTLAVWTLDSLLHALAAEERSFARELLHPAPGESASRLGIIAAGVLFTFAYGRARAAERRLRAQQLRLSLTQFSLDNSADSVFWADRSGRLLYANAAAARRLGYAPAELLGLRVADVDPMFPQPAWEPHWEELRQKRQLRFESQHRSKSGEVFPVEITATMLTHDGQEFICGFVRDISDRKRAEAELRRSRERLQRAQELARVGDWERDLVTGSVGWSDEVYRIMGMPPGEPLGAYADFLRLVHPEDRPSVEESAAAAGREGTPYAADYRMLRPDGTIVFVHATARLVRDELGRPVRLVGTVQDISARKAAEQAIEESEARVRLLLDSTAEGILGAAPDGTVTFLNRSGAAMLGYLDPGELVGKDAHALVHHTKLDGTPNPSSDCACLQVARGERESAHVADDLFWRADGSSFRVEQWARPIRSSGKLTGVVTNFIDVTERRREEEAKALLAEAGAIVSSSLAPAQTLGAIARLVLPGLADACTTFLMGEDGRLGLVEAAAIDPGKEAALRAMADPERLGPDAGEAHPFARALQTRAPVLSPPWMVLPLVARQEVLGVLAMARFSDRPFGPPELAVGEELARRVAASVDSALLFDAAKQAIQVRDDFVSIASHELKTPLATLQLSLQLAARLVAERQRPGSGEPEPADAERRLSELLARARGKCETLAGLIDNLLDVTRVRSGRIELVMEEVDLAEVVREAVLDLSPQLKRSGSELALDLEEGTIGGWDRGRLRQVVTNLLSNAIKYGQGRPIRIEAGGDGRDGGVARLAVHDRGPGLSPEEQRRIFERFERVGATRAVSGLGLGLFIVRQLVRAHHGSVRVESEPGKGASFIVELPLEPDAQPHPAPGAEGRRPQEGEPRHPAS